MVGSGVGGVCCTAQTLGLTGVWEGLRRRLHFGTGRWCGVLEGSTDRGDGLRLGRPGGFVVFDLLFDKLVLRKRSVGGLFVLAGLAPCGLDRKRRKVDRRFGARRIGGNANSGVSTPLNVVIGLD